MCIAIVKKINGSITDDALIQSSRCNRDGGGYAFIDADGALQIKKGFFKVDEFLASYRAEEAIFGPTSPFLIHFRIGTSGSIDKDNCHPFEYEHGALIHNGIFYHAQGNKSDTHELVGEIGKFLSKEAVQEKLPGLKQAFSGNKVALLFKDRTFSIINEESGSWENDVWYSNSSWRSYTPRGGGSPNVHSASGMPAPSRYLGHSRYGYEYPGHPHMLGYDG